MSADNEVLWLVDIRMDGETLSTLVFRTRSAARAWAGSAKKRGATFHVRRAKWGPEQ